MEGSGSLHRPQKQGEKQGETGLINTLPLPGAFRGLSAASEAPLMLIDNDLSPWPNKPAGYMKGDFNN